MIHTYVKCRRMYVGVIREMDAAAVTKNIGFRL